MSSAKPYCTCDKGKYKCYHISHKNLKPTEVDELGVCKYCYHYPVWISKHKRYLRWKQNYSGYQQIILHGTNYLSKWKRAGFNPDTAKCLREENDFEGHSDINSRLDNKYKNGGLE